MSGETIYMNGMSCRRRRRRSSIASPSQQILITKAMISMPSIDCAVGGATCGYHTQSAPQRYLSTRNVPQTNNSANTQSPNI